MVVRIGGVELSPRSTATGYGPRRQVQGPSIGPRVNVSGLSDLAGAVAGMGAAGARYYATRVEEEDERRKYDALEKWNRFQGTFAQRIEDAKLQQPVDGAGYTGYVTSEYDKGWSEFEKQIPADLVPEFRARGEALKQGAILAADGWTREQTRAHSVFSVREATDDAAKVLYEDPDADVEDRLGEQVGAAPGLTAQEREELADEALRQVNGARFGGVVRRGRENSFVVPYSAEVTRRLVPIVIGAESGGRADAVSPKGATGLMQVMPATGAEIAADLRDPNWPKDPRDWSAYLKRPDVNRLYGTFYLNQLLERYGGDLELALIGYNAGPGRADAFRDSGRNWSALPDGVIAETKPYVTGIMRQFGALSPEMAFDPAYGLDFDQALAGESAIEGVLTKAQNDANNRIRARMEAAKAAQESAMNQLYFRAEGGEDFRSMYVRAIGAGEVAYDRAAMTAGIEITNRVNKTAIAREAAFTDLALGNSLSGDQGDFIIGPDVREGLKAQDPKAITSLVHRVGKMGFVPPATQTALEQMLYSTDLRTMATAAQVVQTIQDTNPGALRSLPDDMVARAVSLSALQAAGTPSDQMQMYLAQTRTPEGRAMLAQAQKQDKNYEENKIPTPAEISQHWDGWFSGQPNPPTAGQTTLFQLQYGELYDMYFAQTLDAEAAKDLAMEHTAKTWGVTETGGQKQVAWLPPEMALTNFLADVDGDGTPETVQQTPEQARSTFDAAVAQRYGFSRFAASALPQTMEALQQGKPVPYTIIPLDEDGNPSYSSTDLYTMLTEEPFVYDYSYIQSSLRVLLTNRDILKEDLREAMDAGPMPGETDAAYRGRITDIEIKIQDLNRQLGGK